ncbi:4,5-DOPA dioxygenase extradiol [Sediminibacterium ginsengisoli]|uniref:Aromatic ring-opening dioxygenase, catalytic subunit, LigB family n=1 Tax=Sediminibacterium ginsengisoli TaxID=413434 RepID=A0A1T4PJA0_9BACT|nr:4,5-DOPA dioxygenase extradiol [Sediminibacterium ginsengisoli]SJZ91579.1 Aromatic ring-opening dioxygenase, catalytic subunit, LigB family [Sediminibacterium ginsengisoli]
MQLADLNALSRDFIPTPTMPVLFIGHGSPMNAIEENEFATGWQKVAAGLPKPNAILCISAHWETNGTWVTAMEQPRTIHDFYGFPKALFDVQYNAPGSPALARLTSETIQTTGVGLDQDWGLDHGAWSVLKHMYPDATIPVLQMSLNKNQPPEWHYSLAQELRLLRNRGVLIIGSGNMVHNLGMMNWRLPDAGFDWADEANNMIKRFIQENNSLLLTQYHQLGREISMAVPTPEHYLPLLYILGLQQKEEAISFFNDKTVFGSISMTSLQIGN